MNNSIKQMPAGRKKTLLRCLMMAVQQEPRRPFRAARNYARGLSVYSKKGEIESLIGMTLAEVLSVFQETGEPKWDRNKRSRSDAHGPQQSA